MTAKSYKNCNSLYPVKKLIMNHSFKRWTGQFNIGMIVFVRKNAN